MRGGEGAEVIYALRNSDTFSSLILDGLKNAGQKVRRNYQRRLPSNQSKDYNFLFRDTGITEPVIVEYGFIDNAADINRVVNNYETYAEAVVKAVTEYKGLPYYAPDSMATNEYIVKRGDSLWSIAKKYNVKVEELKSANNLTTDLLSIGQRLIIPNTNSEINYYIVKRGDTLYSIARQNNTTVNELKRLNNLTNDILSIGQSLILPSVESSTTGNTYTVVYGDNLWKISRKFNTTIDEIKRLNNLTSNLLSIGQVLQIP